MSLNKDDELFNCIIDTPIGREFHLEHRWKLKRRFGIWTCYQCLTCGKTISKKEYDKRNNFYDVLF